MQIEIITAIIGIIGTLMGTVLGWGLNAFSARGRLHFFASYSDSFEYNEMGSIIPCYDKDKVQFFSYKVDVDVHNSSANYRLMRDIRIVFINQKAEVLCDIPYADSTRKNSGGLIYYDDISPVNIPGKCVLKIKMHGGFNKNDELKELFDVDKVYLKYRDEKNKEKKVMLKAGRLDKFFETKEEV